MAATDALGHYRVNLDKVPWSTGKMVSFVLAPGFKVEERSFEPGKGTTTADFELASQPWSVALVRLEDPAGKPVAGVHVTCSFGRVAWSRLVTDADGHVNSQWRLRS